MGQIWCNPNAITIPQALRSAAKDLPEKLFLDLDGGHYTFSDIDRESNRIGNGLRAAGVERGDRVAVFLDTSIDFVLLWFGVTKIGAVIVPINTAFRGEFLRHQLNDSGAKTIVIEAHYLDRVAAIADRLSELKTIIYRGDVDALPASFESRPLADIAVADTSPIAVELAPGDLAALLYTSGTTGPSKGCRLSHNMICHSSYPTLVSQGVTREDRLWAALPMFHLAAVGVMFACLRLGTTYVLSSRFSVSGFWPDIERSGATAVFALSTMFPLLIEAPETEAEKRCKGQIRAVFGVPFLREMQERWKERFGIRHAAPAGYGMTECSPIAVYPGHPVPPAATGVPIDCLDVRILADDGTEAAAGVPGEIVLRPKMPYVMFDGYWGRPDATAEAWRDLWFHTGDIGKIDEDGYLYFVDRKKDYLRHRGENISSFELETAFRNHPEIEDVAVHAVSSALSEDEVKATAILREGATATERDICLWAIDHLPYFAVPRFIEFRKELPRNAVGRILKYELRAEGVTAQTWDREAAGIKVKR